ncbi:MAG: hypothetical protein AAGH72_10205 [Verrucomicrobiota bacterium]
MNRANKSVLMGGMIGFFWFCIQFISSELIYRVAFYEILPAEVNDTLYTVSDGIAFPAGEIYDIADGIVTENELGKLSADTSLDQEAQQTAQSLLDRYQSSADFDALLSETYEFLSTYDRYPEVPLWAEYMIYAGTCLVWGIVIGCVTAVLAFYALSGNSAKPEPPALTHQHPTA